MNNIFREYLNNLVELYLGLGEVHDGLVHGRHPGLASLLQRLTSALPFGDLKPKTPCKSTLKQGFQTISFYGTKIFSI